MKMISKIPALLFLGMALTAVADDMKAFPAAESGMVRYALQLPERSDESAFKIEIIVGKTVKVDAENKYFFGGKIEAQNIKGWGYTRYVVDKLGPMAGTRMAVDPDAPKADRFVPIGGEPYLIRYNSRLPVVVYVPAGVEVRYRIWSAEPKAEAMKKG